MKEEREEEARRSSLIKSLEAAGSDREAFGAFVGENWEAIAGDREALRQFVIQALRVEANDEKVSQRARKRAQLLLKRIENPRVRRVQLNLSESVALVLMTLMSSQKTRSPE